MRFRSTRLVRAAAVALVTLAFTISASADTDDGVTVTNVADVDFWSFQDQGLNVGKYDPVLFVEPSGPYHYMYVGDGNVADTLIPNNGVKGQDLYRSTDLRNWTKVADDLQDNNGTQISTQSGTNFNWGRKVGGTYYLYQSRQDTAMHLYTGTDPSVLTYQGQVLDESDAGGFYDDATSTWHMYYEAGNISGPSGDALGHATSSDGVNWTKQSGFALNLGPTGLDTGWKTGDPDIIKVNDTYHMFIDNTIDHPDYRIAWATSSDLYTWELQEHAITHWPGGDAVVRYLEDTEEFIMYQEYRGTAGTGESGRAGIGYATAPAQGFLEAEAVDPASVAGLVMWLKDPAENFIEGAGATDATWLDSSGNANHMQTLAVSADADPTLIQTTDPVTGMPISAVQFADGATELMKSDLRGADNDDGGTEGNFDNVTIFAIYRIQQTDNMSSTRPYGIGANRDEVPTTADHLNAASDPSIRKDNGFIDETDEPLPIDRFFIRIIRMTNSGANTDDLDEWLYVPGNPLDLLQTRGSPYVTSDDDFFLGDLRLDAAGIDGDDFAIAEVLVYDEALSDSDILAVNQYLANQLEIPEPATAALLALGGLSLIRRRRC